MGAIALSVLPVEQYPDLTPPQVEVNATYTGASANVIAETVASLLESQINGVDNMIYMNSVSSGTGSMSLTLSLIHILPWLAAGVTTASSNSSAAPTFPASVSLAVWSASRCCFPSRKREPIAQISSRSVSYTHL